MRDRPAHARFAPTDRPRLAAPSPSPDVIVIGAGAAGIAAARHLIASGLRVAVLEARDRVGGRAVTTALRGHPVDLGAHWLHAGPVNPLVALGRARGEPLRKAPQASHLVVDRRAATASQRHVFARAFDRADRTMTRAAQAPGADRSVATVPLPGLGPWREGITRVHALVSGRPLDRVSLQDWPSLEYGDNHFVRGGYGAYLARLAQDLPIRLSAPVVAIDWSGRTVRVETADGGSITARAAIVTLPVTVLQRSVRFTPALPAKTRSAIDGFLAGIYEHVVLHWPSAPFRGADRLASFLGGRHRPPGLLTRIDDEPFHYFEFDTAFAETVDALGRGDAARRLVREALSEHVGASRLNDLAMPAVTEWRHDPWSRGSWAVVPPGHAGARIALREPVGERIWFAGEALSRVQWGTVGGAYAEGTRAAIAATERRFSRSAA